MAGCFRFPKLVGDSRRIESSGRMYTFRAEIALRRFVLTEYSISLFREKAVSILCFLCVRVCVCEIIFIVAKRKTNQQR